MLYIWMYENEKLSEVKYCEQLIVGLGFRLKTDFVVELQSSGSGEGAIYVVLTRVCKAPQLCCIDPEFFWW